MSFWIGASWPISAPVISGQVRPHSALIIAGDVLAMIVGDVYTAKAVDARAAVEARKTTVVATEKQLAA